MTSAFSSLNSVSLCHDSSFIPSPNLPVTPEFNLSHWDFKFHLPHFYLFLHVYFAFCVLKLHINIQLTYFSCLFYDYIWWQIFLIRRVTEQQMCKIENWKYLNRCLIFILHEMIRNVESTFDKGWETLKLGRLWIGIALEIFSSLIWRIQTFLHYRHLHTIKPNSLQLKN